jgi:transcriptional regulator with XRE-family HTH domain
MITPVQCRMARAALEIGVRDLAKLAGVSAMTVTRFENGHSEGYPATLEKLRAALESAGVEFTNGNAPGVKLHKAGAKVASIPIEDLNAENDE